MKARFWVVAAAALGLCACWKNDSLAGGTTTETEASIMGIISKPDGSAAVGARVRIRPVAYLSPGASDTADYGNVTADSSGRFSWNTKDTGSFNLEAALGDSLGTLIRSIRAGKEAAHLTGTLDTSGGLQLNLLAPAAGAPYVLRVYGMERYALADSLGHFHVTLPAGEYRVAVTGGTAPVVPMVVDGVRIERGRVSLLDSMRLPNLDSALLGYWPLDEGSGPVVGDKSGNGVAGTLVGAKWMPGISGTALQFAKGQGYVDLGAPAPDPFAFQGSDFTFSAWAKIGIVKPNRGFGRRIISKQKNGSYSHYLRILSDGKPGFHCLPSKLAKASAFQAISVYDLIAPVNVGDGAWHHLAGVLQKGRLSLYVDGKLRASGSGDSIPASGPYTDYNDGSGVLYPDPGTDGHLMLGCVNSGVDGFDGLIDEARVYGRALTPQEVFRLANPPAP